ncbi:hypothetical protein BJ165DRAFT_1513377 [Panaeolus papilionaceus]|nr:hypothetical protein BJ165DRAFT_1513377 [Panaeolus papilionaceus]
MPQSNLKDELSISLHTFFPKIHTLRVQDQAVNINRVYYYGVGLRPLTLGEYIIQDFFSSPTISVLDFDLIDHGVSFPEIILNFPSLRIWRARSILTFSKMWKNERQALMQPWKLQELCVGNARGFAFPILRYCPDLVRLEMNLVHPSQFVLDAVPDSNQFNREPVVVYKNLHTLTLDSSMTSFVVLLEAAEREGVDAMPALQSFTVADPPSEENKREALTMVLKHAPNLQTLVLLYLSGPVPPVFFTLMLSDCILSTLFTISTKRGYAK